MLRADPRRAGGGVPVCAAAHHPARPRCRLREAWLHGMMAAVLKPPATNTHIIPTLGQKLCTEATAVKMEQQTGEAAS